jgi:hypothetical protein
MKASGFALSAGIHASFGGQKGGRLHFLVPAIPRN